MSNYVNERERNPSPPPYTSFAKREVKVVTTRQLRHLNSAADHAELERHYTFLPPSSNAKTCWQDRMVQHYHSHLYREYVLADLTRPGQVGLRWRTQEEVKRGKGDVTCGNKQCPSYQQQQQQQISTGQTTAVDSLLVYSRSDPPTTEEEEETLLETVPPGSGLYDYEVPFTYQEHGTSKSELVKLRLCLRCAPLLFRTKDPIDCALAARRARMTFGPSVDIEPGQGKTQEASNDKNHTKKQQGSRRRLDSSSESLCSSDDDEEPSRRRRRRRKKKRRR
jgi:protein FRA10AC1